MTIPPLSQIAQNMRPSPIRELFKVIGRPGMISFAGGLPSPQVFPVREFAECSSILQRDGATLLQYGASEGYPPLTEWLREATGQHLRRSITPEELLVTSGSQQALDLVGRALLDPGDVVVVEAPTYPGAIHALRNVGARFAAVPCDGEGMQVDRLRDVVEAAEKQTGRWPKLIYTIPDFSNPSGACMSLARRRQLVDTARELGIPVFEDDPYGRLRYLGEPVPALASLDGASGSVLYASSFSKILAPGVRVAWIVGPPRLIRALVMLRQGEDLCTPVVTQGLVAEYCRRGLLERHLPRILDHYRVKRDAMQAELRRALSAGGAEWYEPEGGFFFWLRLPGRDSQAVFDRAIEEKVAFLPGRAFYPGDSEQVGQVRGGREFARLAFTFAEPDQIAEGCRRLAKVLD